MPGDPALVCRHVAEDGAPIRVAVRGEAEGAEDVEWQFLCGATGHPAEDGRVWSLAEVVRRDPSAAAVVERPRGTRLERAGPGASWRTAAGPLPLPRHASRRWPDLEPRWPPRPGEPLDDADLRVLADVADEGWHTRVVPADAEGPGHAFTVGLLRTFDHPELIAVGLPPPELPRTVNRLAERIRRGERFGEGDRADDVLEGRPVAFRRVAQRHVHAWLGDAVWYHGSARFPVLQAVWPDEAGRFPWEPWFDRRLRERQPILAAPQPA